MALQTNPELECAFELVRHTNKSVFLTGKAGSGKTTFLHQIKEDGLKQLVVVAPTGVAAINARGMTIHSFFQLPFGVHLPDSRRNDQQSRRVSRKKIQLMRGLDLLVIDEISMVRADLLDAIDATLRYRRRDNRPFGGVQLLMIGDLHQLPPVAKAEDWELLKDCYDTPYFFSSQALKKTDYVSLELKHIYRQSDAKFIELLNKVRDNRLDADTLEMLNSRYVAKFRPKSEEGYITLTATNAEANDINTRNLAQLRGKPRTFAAQIQGEFPPSAYPTEETLEVKVGAQVMFIKNDTESKKRYFNGKIGRITGFFDEFISVRCLGDSSDIVVAQAEWQNIRYSLNEETKEVEEQVLGMFIQYPLKLAWAITIHKSQGLTFDRALIDAQAAFAHGQVYVALSRCRSFEGIVLRSRIDLTSVKTDQVVKNYSAEMERNTPSEEHIREAKRELQLQLVAELFDFHVAQQNLQSLCSLYLQHQNTLTAEAASFVQKLAERAASELFVITDRFQPQLLVYLHQEAMPESNQSLQERVRKAAVYFTDKITGIMQEARTIPTTTDNKAVRDDVVGQLVAFQEALFTKRACFEACAAGFVAQAYQRGKVRAALEFAAQPVAAISRSPSALPKDAPHPQLYRQLLDYRDEMASKNNIAPYEVLPNATVRELVMCLPTGKKLLDVSGIGKARWTRYGQDISEMITRYCSENKVPTNQQQEAKTSARTSGTKSISFDMFRSGQSIEQIAAERKLTPGTIEGHLTHFIALGQLDVSEIVAPNKVEAISAFFTVNPSFTFTEAKSHFGGKYTYGELKLVHAHLQHKQPDRNG